MQIICVTFRNNMILLRMKQYNRIISCPNIQCRPQASVSTGSNFLERGWKNGHNSRREKKTKKWHLPFESLLV